jgi:hypothetical protein
MVWETGTGGNAVRWLVRTGRVRPCSYLNLDLAIPAG